MSDAYWKHRTGMSGCSETRFKQEYLCKPVKRNLACIWVPKENKYHIVEYKRDNNDILKPKSREVLAKFANSDDARIWIAEHE